MATDDAVDRAAELICRSHYMVAFTGAGHSTASGVPDFRSPGSGLWQKHDPMLVASIWAFRLNPKGFYDWLRPLAEMMTQAAPNPAHLALATLEEMGLLKAVITQNIDNLHQRAGSRRVLELHGHTRDATCIRCYAEVPMDAGIEQQIRHGHVPRCRCGGVLKPNVILFGEQLPLGVWHEAMEEAHRSDLMLVAGSSLTVTPAADIPFSAVEHGAQAIIVNMQPTFFDARANVVIHGDVAAILPRIVEAVQTNL